MKFELHAGKKLDLAPTLKIMPAFAKTASSKKKSSKNKKEESVLSLSWPKEIKEGFEATSNHHVFKGEKGKSFLFHTENGNAILAIGLGDKSKIKSEDLRKAVANIIKQVQADYSRVYFCLDSWNLLKDHERSVSVMVEAIDMTTYQYLGLKSKPKKNSLTQVHFITEDSSKKSKIKKAIDETQKITESLNVTRDLVNDPPNKLNSETYARFVETDVRTNLKGAGVKIKVLGKTELKKEKMGLFLSVNAGSSYGPRLVHLTYTPKGATSKTKHIALVGKGITFDTGGYSLKPGSSMVNMKFDMGGSATVYGAFRAAVLNRSKNKITCILGMTDNAISGLATMPDAVCTARNGTTVEILNTDAEGRLVLADCLDYACDLKPHVVIDAATLTGAMLISLGKEVCGMFNNDKDLGKDLLSSAKESDEYMWEMPIIEEFRQSIASSPIADLANIGKTRFAGSCTAAAFLEHFIKNDVKWAHLDVAGVADGQDHLPYCPSRGGSGLIVRSLYHYLNK